MPVASSGELNIHYEVLGSLEDPVVVFVNGLGEQIGGVAYPDDLARALVDEGLAVIRLDNRDAGLSSELADAGAPDLDAAFSGAPVDVPYSLTDMAGDVIAVLDDAGVGEAHLMGMSMGGFICRWAAITHPERVASLTLVVTGAGAGEHDEGPQVPDQAAAQLVAAAQARERAQHIEGSVDFWRWLWGDGFPFDEEDVRRAVTAAHDRSYRPEGTQRQLLSALATPGLWEAQREIRCPTLILHGDRDPIFSAEHGEAMRERIPGAELWLVEGMGHSVPRAIWPELVSRLRAQATEAQASAPAS